MFNMVKVALDQTGLTPEQPQAFMPPPQLGKHENSASSLDLSTDDDHYGNMRLA